MTAVTMPDDTAVCSLPHRGRAGEGDSHPDARRLQEVVGSFAETITSIGWLF